MSLSCGGRGPCCHVGYAHRHCEHCDVVIPTVVQPHYHGGYYAPYYSQPWNQTYQQGIYNSLQGGLNSQLSSLLQSSLPTDHVIHVEVEHAGE